MQQFRTYAFYMAVCRHKLGEMENECISHSSIILAICVSKIIKFGRYLMKFRQKQIGIFFGPPCMPKT